MMDEDYILIGRHRFENNGTFGGEGETKEMYVVAEPESTAMLTTTDNAVEQLNSYRERTGHEVVQPSEISDEKTYTLTTGRRDIEIEDLPEETYETILEEAGLEP